jgi:hypothetical protein
MRERRVGESSLPRRGIAAAAAVCSFIGGAGDGAVEVVVGGGKQEDRRIPWSGIQVQPNRRGHSLP